MENLDPRETIEGFLKTLEDFDNNPNVPDNVVKNILTYLVSAIGGLEKKLPASERASYMARVSALKRPKQFQMTDIDFSNDGAALKYLLLLIQKLEDLVKKDFDSPSRTEELHLKFMADSNALSREIERLAPQLKSPDHVMLQARLSSVRRLMDSKKEIIKTAGKLPSEITDQDVGAAVLRTLQAATGGKTWLSKYIGIAGLDLKSLLVMHGKGSWEVDEGVAKAGFDYDEVVTLRPQLVTKMHPFFVSREIIEDLENNPPPPEKEFLIDQPFPTVWLEATDGGALFAFGTDTWIVGILCHEIDTTRYLAEVLTIRDDRHHIFMPLDLDKIKLKVQTIELSRETVFNKRPHSFLDNQSEYDPYLAVQTATHDVLYWTFKRFRTDFAFANEKIPPIRERVGTGANRQKIKINQLVRVMLKKERKNYERSVGHPVDWSHKWEVMGHWRKIDGIGKDKLGEYVVRGQTWVKPHEKGKGDLVKKTRLVIDGGKENGSGPAATPL